MSNSIYKILFLIATSFATTLFITCYSLFPYIAETVKVSEIFTYKVTAVLTLLALHLIFVIAAIALYSCAKSKPLISTEFLSNISHEIRTPMNAIIGSANLLENEPLNPTQQKYIKSIAQAGQNILTIANEILDYSKIRSDKHNIHNEAFEIYDKINYIYTIFKPLAEEKGLKLNLSCSKLPLALIGDPSAIVQILSNFINNAIKFTQEGSITLSVETEELTKTQTSLKFSVIDTGIGIPKKEQSKVFKIYEQVSGDAIIKASGTGLGLFISKHLAESMEGTIGFSSTEDKGSTFWLKATLPIASTEESAAIIYKDSATEFPIFKAKVLLAEDSMTNNFIITSILEKLGCTVDSVTNGQHAVEKAANNQYDIIFMDRAMPAMNGIEATKIIRREEKEKSTIIALTAGVFLEEKEDCLNAGMDYILSKPVVIDDFANVFNDYVPHLKIKDSSYMKEGDYISWSDKLSLNIDSIDAQHKNICKYINMLHKAMTEKNSEQVLEQVLYNLLEYTEVHFDYEEKYFHEFNFEFTDQHCATHRAFKQKIIDFIYKYNNKEEDITEELFQLLTDWLVNHILLEDLLYVECFKKNGLK